jgi:hypothetical protein
MATIERSRFLTLLPGGLTLNDSQVSAALTQRGVSMEALGRLDGFGAEGDAPESPADELARRIEAMEVTLDNALDVARTLQGFTFNKGGLFSHGTTAQQEWTRFVQSRLLSDFAVRSMISVLNRDPNGTKVETRYVAWIVADELKSLATEFIAQQKQNAKLDS